MKGLKVLKLEFNVYGQYDLGFDKLFDEAERITTLSSLLFTSEQFIMISKIEWKDEADIESIRRSIIIDDIIEVSREEKTSMCIVIGHLPPIVSELISHVIKEFKCFFEFPIVNVKGKMSIPLVGTKENLKNLLEHLKELNVEFTVLSLTNYFIKGKDMLSSLTPAQYACLEMAFELGFFDIPKKADARKLASQKGISHSAFLTHIRKAERKIFDELFG
ncbi:MAG: helix-turn-helix domain-containing protein [Methanomassiliicoccales archaeon]|nr:MAG: helix-turn-helix domain-containing protein [Methanomassiliicoccales archaeon]